MLNNEELTDSHLPVMVDIGSCNLHKVHNAFGKGLDVFGHDAEDLALKLFYSLKHSAARREDLKIVQFALELDSVFFCAMWKVDGYHCNQLLQEF